MAWQVWGEVKDFLLSALTMAAYGGIVYLILRFAVGMASALIMITRRAAPMRVPVASPPPAGDGATRPPSAPKELQAGTPERTSGS